MMLKDRGWSEIGSFSLFLLTVMTSAMKNNQSSGSELMRFACYMQPDRSHDAVLRFCSPQEGSFKTLYKMKFYIISSGNLCVGTCSSMRYGVGVILVVMAVGVVTK